MRSQETTVPSDLQPTLNAESAAWASGARWVAGVDEVGRGALAGPVLAAAVVLLPGQATQELASLVRDSKLLTAEQRCSAYPLIRHSAHAIGVGQASARAVDMLGIARANALAMRRALQALALVPDFVLVDGYQVPGWSGAQRAIIRGDRTVAAIAAASIVAKVTRDAAMIGLDARHPGYGFDRHKGYGTAGHLAALAELGPSVQHRLSWAPLRALA
jgi:ribonuclease HII